MSFSPTTTPPWGSPQPPSTTLQVPRKLSPGPTAKGLCDAQNRWKHRATNQPRPISDADGRIFAVLAGQPNDASYKNASHKAFTSLSEAGDATHFRPKDKKHRRGHFPALNVGVTHGKGTAHPINLNTKPYDATVKRVLQDPNIQRLASFADASFALWAPNIYHYYQSRLNSLWIKMPELRKNFHRSIFTSAAFNFGPQVRTFKHRDYLNCPFGWCSVQALGTFDATKGSHLILWEARLVIEFPAGSLVLIPSATITHSNTPSLPHENRVSFTQYCAGGLFRYVDNGFRTDHELEIEDPTLFNELLKLKNSRWESGLKLYSTLSEIRHS
ncbi:hypothetical protein BDN72DRAFT_872812 [Pluteus cervinus]|uniref:Uncharacterized protein n=1 Tax=Pluteus cervinus TaxID=181527 RepID=A0ACD3A6V2_9AGAR|nr:hypothetical protein BDN72DRAFT_872812 [Pluteus cervinus]